MNPFDQQAPIEGVKNIITVGSGKGGVGKSTVSTNLAIALNKLGLKVGLLDADIYGPSIPRMLGCLNQKPEVDAEQKIQPLTRYGLKLMSIGFLVPEDSAVIWRGPMLFKAMEQFFRDVKWGELDYLIIDLPPGTGDVALTVAQKIPVNGSITVTTPQNMSLIDAKKSIDMFERVNIPLLGVIENMSYLVLAEKDENGENKKMNLFPKGDLNQYLEAKHITKLGEIPFNNHVGMAGEAGIPIVESDPSSLEAKAFMTIAESIVAGSALTSPQ